ncbi:MAG: galactose-1-phosphate uridylyltransferase, partial [Thermoguttaceae bacterium]
MPEYRRNPLDGRLVVIAPERAARPHQFDIANGKSPEKNDSSHLDCPFCEGNEFLTPGELVAFRRPGTPPDSPGWTARAVPNKFPAVRTDIFKSKTSDVESANESEKNTLQNNFADISDKAELETNCSQIPTSEFDSTFLSFLPIPGFGHHEVLIDTPRHLFSISEMNEDEVTNMLSMYQHRLKSLRKEEQWQYIQIFKNVGAAAGASIPHAHSQLVALPFIPPTQWNTLLCAAKYRDERNQSQKEKISSCYWCEMLHEEGVDKRRIAAETLNFLVLCPFASRFSGELEIYPKEHFSHFDDVTNVSEMAGLLIDVIKKLETSISKKCGEVAPPLAYNLVLHTAPCHSDFLNTDQLG